MHMHTPILHILYTVDERVTLDFGKTLQQARMAKSLSQKELATVTGHIYIPCMYDNI